MNPFINVVAQIHPLISILEVETSLLSTSENEAGVRDSDPTTLLNKLYYKTSSKFVTFQSLPRR